MTSLLSRLGPEAAYDAGSTTDDHPWGDDVRLEAIFVAAEDPATAAGELTAALGLPAPDLLSDGQQQVSGLGTFLAVEPASAITPDGSVTIWIRVEDVSAAVEAFGSGVTVLQAPTSAGRDTVATVLTAAGIRIGLIG